MSQEKYERKPYFYNMTLEDTRFAFRISSKMLNVKKNFAQKYRRNNLSLTCELCREEETERDNESSQPHQDIQEKLEESQFHLANDCIAFSELRSHTEFSSDQQTVAFFKIVMEK